MDNGLPSLNGLTVLVTGGTGSFGKKFVEKVLLESRPKKLIVFKSPWGITVCSLQASAVGWFSLGTV